MYGYLDRFVKDWSEDDLIAVLSRLPYSNVADKDWAALIAAIGVQNFIHLSLILSGKEIRIPTLFEVLSVIAAEGIVEKSKSMPLDRAKKHILGELEIKEIDQLVERLQSAEGSTDTVDGAST